jgi:hypothetical protein
LNKWDFLADFQDRKEAFAGHRKSTIRCSDFRLAQGVISASRKASEE